MKLVKMLVNDYRQFEHVELEFDEDVTIVAGANNSGKTSLITLIRDMISSEKIPYGEADIPAKNMKEWIDKVYPLFEAFFRDGASIDEIEGKLVNKILPVDDENGKIEIKTTEVQIQVDYNMESDDIKLFADYIMDLDENEHSFYFIYQYEVNRHLFSNDIFTNFDKLKKRFDELDEPNKELKERYLQEMLVKIYIKAIKPVCYFCDKTYENKCKMEDVKELRKLFNFTYIKASRPLDDDALDHSHTLSRQMIQMAKLDEQWQELIKTLPDELLKPIQEKEIDKTVREASLNSLKDTITELEKTNGGQTGELMLDMNVTEDDISDLLQRITTTTYKVDGYFLGEASQGLGYSNMIYMHLQLKEYEKSMDPLKVNVFFIEEPESHMHPQMQQVFIKYLLDYYKKTQLQGVVTTHSNEMVRVAGISHLRVIRKMENFRSNLYNLSSLVKKSREEGAGESKALANFFDWFFEIGYSEIVFADKVIMYEGDTERLFIRKLLTLPEYEKLSQQYIAYIQVGGAYAYNYQELIDLLKIKTLIITDIDYDKAAVTKSDITQSKTTNATINNFYKKETGAEKPTIQQLYEWKENKGNICNEERIYLTFQTSKDGYTRTFEEAMLNKYFELDATKCLKRSDWEDKKRNSGLQYSIPRNRDSAEDSEFYLRDILNSSSGKKTDFMYSVILNDYVSKMQPDYISEGLKWLME